MAELLKEPNFDRENVFYKAFHMLNYVYRFVRCKGYIISMPNLRNVPKNGDKSSSVFGAAITVPYSNLFITAREGPQRELRTIFNDTQKNLAGLLQIVYPDSPFTAKDEQSIPGDYGNPGNPFKINIEL